MAKQRETSKRQIVEDWISDNYEIRYNTVRKVIEWKAKGQKTFEEIDDFTMNSMVSRMDKECFFTPSVNVIFSIVMSDFVEKYNPLQEYFNSLKFEYNEQNLFIKKFANCVKLKTERESQVFAETLKRWMVASVANALTPEGCQNHHCIVLTGEQGAFKTTYIDCLFPTDLRKYCFTGKIRLEEKDTVLKLGTFFIINLDDQLRKLFKKDSETMKTLITQPDFYERLPYGKLPTKIERIANFIGSINGSEFLNDSTGNRRYLPFEVETINIEHAKELDINKAWFEAFTMFKNGFKYYFDKSELEELFGSFEAFTTMTPEEELFYTYFEPLTPEMQKDNRFRKYRTTEILLHLKNMTFGKIEVNSKVLGELLKNKIKPVPVTWDNGKRGYWLRELYPDEINKNN